MKLIIDIPEDVYKKTVFYREFKDLNDCVTTIKALENGTPIPNNATNGDVIKAMFPDCDEIGVQYELTKNCNGWLDEPYQKRGCFRPTDDNSGTFCI